MSAVDRVAALLEERGVEYERNGKDDDIPSVRWFGRGGLRYLGINSNGDNEMLFLNSAYVSPEDAVELTLGPVVDGDTSDGYHTFNELYHHRAVLFSVIVREHRSIAWKAKRHHDGTMYDGMFIVGLNTPHGQATYHYDINPYWDMFDCAELDRAPEWDGHTPDEAIERIGALKDADGRTTTRNGKHRRRYGRLVPLCECCGQAIGDERYNYCPKCGARIVDDE